MKPTTDLWPQRVSILGVGLLGGSVGMAIKRRLPECEVVGYSRTAAKRQLAIERGAIDRAESSAADACQGADVVVVAATVDHIAAMAIDAAQASPAGCLITDVGSTKASIVAGVGRVPAAAHKFIAAHPIAGSEKTGVENARESLFDRKVIVLTPGDQSDTDLLEKAERFWRLTGGQIVRLSPADHDAHLAAVSHVPHLVSAAVTRMLPTAARSLAGSGWRDITRVAAGDPDMWTAICRENRAAIVHELARLIDDLGDLQASLQSGDDQALQQWLTAAQMKKTESPFIELP